MRKGAKTKYFIADEDIGTYIVGVDMVRLVRTLLHCFPEGENAL